MLIKRILTVFALVASIAGISIAGATPASAYHGGYCFNTTFSLANQNTYSPCVAAIQFSLNLRIGSTLIVDGYYGPWTAIAELIDEDRHPHFDDFVRPLNGQVDAHSSDWFAHCYTMSSTANPYGDMWAYFSGCA